jgi:drug/metabolite transporter (DMT)-like permease
VLCFAGWIAVARPSWPRNLAQALHHAVAGMLMHGGYLGGVWAAIRGGMGAGTVALLVGLQPMLTALWITTHAPRGGHVTRRQWIGLGLGLAGLVLVVWRKLGVGEVTAANLVLALGALLSITAGTLYQKRFVAACDVRSAAFVQLSAALAVTLPLAAIETAPIQWHPQLLGALAWSVLVLTLGGSSLLYLLIQRGAATAVASLMYLVPPCTALLAWLLFGETFTPAMLAGLLLTVAGVALVVNRAASAPNPEGRP